MTSMDPLESHRRRMAAWVQEHGIDPVNVPTDARIEVHGDRVTIEVIRRDSRGGIITDGLRVMRTSRTVPLYSPLPGFDDTVGLIEMRAAHAGDPELDTTSCVEAVRAHVVSETERWLAAGFTSQPEPRQEPSMPDILDAIDRATDGLCPCGTPPAPGSAYCSDDCRPALGAGNWINAARWRPNKGGCLDESGLTSDVDPWADTFSTT